MAQVSEQERGPVGEDPACQHRERRVQRWGLVLMALIVLLGLLGFWGHGPLSRAAESTSDGRISVSHERFARNTGNTEVLVRVAPHGTDRGTTRLRVDQECLSSYRVQSLRPQPSTVTTSGHDLVYAFSTDGGSELVARMDLRPTGGMGPVDCAFGLKTPGEVRVWQWVYP